MIKISYGALNSSEFSKELLNLMDQKGWASAQASYNIARIYRQAHAAIQEGQKIYHNIIKDNIMLDESGKYKLADVKNTYCPFELKPEVKDEIMKKIEKLFSDEIALESYPIKLADLGEVKISPKQFINLAAIFDSGDLSQLGV